MDQLLFLTGSVGQGHTVLEESLAVWIWDVWRHMFLGLQNIAGLFYILV